jgi:hypothetical protein
LYPYQTALTHIQCVTKNRQHSVSTFDIGDGTIVLEDQRNNSR